MVACKMISFNEQQIFPFKNIIFALGLYFFMTLFRGGVHAKIPDHNLYTFQSFTNVNKTVIREKCHISTIN